jgi:hypothetical protein
VSLDKTTRRPNSVLFTAYRLGVGVPTGSGVGVEIGAGVGVDSTAGVGDGVEAGVLAGVAEGDGLAFAVADLALWW